MTTFAEIKDENEKLKTELEETKKQLAEVSQNYIDTTHKLSDLELEHRIFRRAAENTEANLKHMYETYLLQFMLAVLPSAPSAEEAYKKVRRALELIKERPDITTLTFKKKPRISSADM